jgi:hypothetical protein
MTAKAIPSHTLLKKSRVETNRLFGRRGVLTVCMALTIMP